MTTDRNSSYRPQGNPPVSVSVCICTRNRAGSLENTIDAVLKSKVPSDRPVELIIIDNDSDDSTKDVVAKFKNTAFPMRYIVEKRLGLSAARNCAVAASTSDVLMFTDDDVIVPSDWIEGVSSMFDDLSVHAVQGRIHLHDDVRKPWMEDMHLQFLAVFDYPNANSLTGANMSVRRSSLIAIGGFDESYGPGTDRAFGDDTVIGFRMAKEYGGIAIYKGAPVIHCPNTSRLSRKALLDRIDKQVDVELAIRAERGIGLPRQALRPVWINQLLFLVKVLRERISHPSSPATEAEICARRSVALSLAVQRARSVKV